MQLHPLLVAALALSTVAALGCDHTTSSPSSASAPLAAPSGLAAPEPPPIQAPPSALAVLGGLKVGDDIAGWKVEELTLTDDSTMKGALAIALAQHDTKFTIWVARKGGANVRPPYTTRDHDVFFGPAEIQATAVQPAVDRILELVKANETTAPAGGSL
jgi:hypothetical protein